ncbi:anti-sigma-D factor RsdA [Rhodococcus gannanensis]|uniref:Anti-sigma-D factor RsdA n=1 Tax=Rhodococcus gannanensis TaxID=1960308 RepID=A0ABW4P1S6_9NOCA
MARGSKRGHRDWSRKHDASDADLTPQGDPLAGEASEGEPFDLAAVQRDDALIDALASGGDVPTATAEEYRLAALLAGWRAEIVEPELPAGPTLDEVAAAVDAEIARERAPKRGSLHLLRPVAGAAAAIAVVMAGLTVGSYNAQPGDPLWRVKEVVFTERANSTVASIDTTNNLEEAERMLRSGDSQGAMAVLESASKRVGAVNDAAKRDELNAWYDRLLADATSVLPVPPAVPGVSTTPVGPIETTLPGVPPTSVPQYPTDGVVAPTQPPVTPLPVDTTVLPVVPPTTTVPTPGPEILLTPDPGSTGPAPTSILVPVPTSQKVTTETRQLIPSQPTS